MKVLKDITQEQAIEIVKLLYPFPDWVKSEFEYKYQPYIEEWGLDAVEYIYVHFKGYTFGDTIDKIRVFIYKDLDCTIDIYQENPIEIKPLPVRNQYLIQKKFMEWEIIPEPFK